MTVSVGPGTIGTRAVNKDYPIEEGLTQETKQTGNPSLVPEVNLTPEDQR